MMRSIVRVQKEPRPLSASTSHIRFLGGIALTFVLLLAAGAAMSQTAALYLDAKIQWSAGFGYFDTPQEAFAAIDAHMRETQGGNFAANLRPGRTWEDPTTEGQCIRQWAYNKRIPWAFDAHWGPGGPSPGERYSVCGAIDLVWSCPEGSYFTYYDDWPAVRRWFFCAVGVALDPLPSEQATCSPPSPAIGNPVFPIAGVKAQREFDVPSSSLSVGRIYRSDSGRFEFEGTQGAVIRRLPQDPFADASLSHSGTACMMMRDTYPPNAYSCYPIIGYESSPPSGPPNLTTHLLKLPGEGFREITVPTGSLRRAELGREVWAAAGGYRILSASNELSMFDSTGTLQSVLKPNGQATTFDYANVLNPWDRRFPRAARDVFGRAIQYEYNGQGFLARLIGVDARSTEFSYDEAPFTCATGACGALTSVRFPDGEVKRYRYNEPGHISAPTAGLLLTGVIDEKGDRFGTYKYDAQFRPYLTESAGGANRWSVDYSVATHRTVTPPVGSAFTVRTVGQSGYALLAGYDQPAGSGCGPSSSAISYDANVNVTSRIDFNSNKICYAYDLARNLETKRVEGLSASAVCSTALSSPPAGARVITTAWHPDWRLETRIAEPKKITTSVYNGQGATCAPGNALVDGRPIAVVCSRTEQATTDESGAAGFSATTTGTPRTWRYTYTTYGRVLTATDPNNRITTTTYHPDNDPDLGKRGNVASITNAANHIIYITNYNAHGQPTRIVDPNGVVTVLTYDPRMRLTSRTVGNEATVFGYDPVGQMTSVNLPDGARLTYTYDAAHRLTAINDHKGNRIDYTLDAMGNRTAEQMKDLGGVLVQNIARVIDALNRVQQVTGSVQ